MISAPIRKQVNKSNIIEMFPKNRENSQMINQTENSKHNVNSNSKRFYPSRKGTSVEVYAFKTKEEILKMIEVFDKHITEASNNDQRQIAARNKMLFIVGICVGLRAKDLCERKWCDFYKKDGDNLIFRKSYTLQPSKTKKDNKYVTLTYISFVQKAVSEYVSEYPIDDLEDYVFFSRNSKFGHIKTEALWGVINNAAKEAGIEQNVGTHSLRKTFGFWAWRCSSNKNLAIESLRKCFNHSNTEITRRYIGLLDEEVESVFTSLESEDGYSFLNVFNERMI